MKPDPTSPSGKNPSRKRPDSEKESRPASLGEDDLWDLDGDDEAPAKTPEPEPAATVSDEESEAIDEKPAPAVIPVTPRDRRRDAKSFTASPPKGPIPSKKTDEEKPATAVTSPSAKRPKKQPVANLRQIDDTFEDLDAVETPAAPAEIPPEPETPKSSPKPAESTAAIEDTETEESAPPPIPIPRPVAKSLSKIEKIGLLSFLILVLGGGLFFVAHSISKLPSEKKFLTTGDFPIKGTNMETLEFTSYWRDPVTSGPTPDTVRRGTIILPVVELKVTGGPAAVRIFFRNSEGLTVGDAVTRPVNGEATLTLPATAGFEEPGMHAAYRTGDAKPWLVEVFEGPSIDADGKTFRKLFEIPISTIRR